MAEVSEKEREDAVEWINTILHSACTECDDHDHPHAECRKCNRMRKELTELYDSRKKAGYRRGIEDAAKVANEAAVDYSASSKQIGDYHHAKVVAANSIAAAIRALGKAEEGTAPR